MAVGGTGSKLWDQNWLFLILSTHAQQVVVTPVSSDSEQSHPLPCSPDEAFHDDWVLNTEAHPLRVAGAGSQETWRNWFQRAEG